MESSAIQLALDILAADYKEDYKHTPKPLKKNHVYKLAEKAKKQLDEIEETKFLLFHVNATIGEHRCLYPQCEKDILRELNERLISNYKTVWEFQQSPEYAQEYIIIPVVL